MLGDVCDMLGRASASHRPPTRGAPTEWTRTDSPKRHQKSLHQILKKEARRLVKFDSHSFCRARRAVMNVRTASTEMHADD